MPKPAHVHIVISGTSPAGEVWATGFDTAGEAGNQATLDAAVNAVADGILATGAAHTMFTLVMNAGQSITQVTGYSYAADSSAANLLSSATCILGGSGDAHNPLQTCVVATLRTAVPSRRARGRMYLPCTGMTLGADAFLSSAQTDIIVAGVQQLLGLQGDDVIPVVLSSVGNSSNPITSITADNRTDVQRRRANKQLATHTSTAPYPPA
uniref:Uncharacterized protein n=1 Tax=uncultured prokaryote TaxID=198431 RepID=A0A0H5Q2R6_9ZZZZ|nr:hypothetical protein [uncultured prokaryote]